MKKLTAICLTLVIMLGLCCFANAFAAAEGTGAETTVLDHWSEDSPAMKSLVDFVEKSVDETSEGYIPKEDRIAVFDNDGTLYGERFPTYFNDWLYIQRALYDENYEAPEELKVFAQAWEDKVLRGVPIEDFDAKERELGPKLYEGLTPDEYDEVVRRFKQLPVWGFEGMTYGEAFFQPMVSLVKYLYDNDYTVYIVSATYRDAVRVLTEGVLDEYIPRDHVIGTDLLYVASGDADKDSMFYELTPEDQLVIAGELFLKNQKTNKATMIQQEIGRMPVLAFGNSTGDFSMATYTLQNEKYGGRAYMLLCDDTERDYGSPETAASFKQKCDANGFYTVSMRDEFSTIYGDGVKMSEAEQKDTDRAPALLSEYWTEGSEAAESLNTYLRAVTDESSPDFIPVKDRIAVFDLDGTLMCETYPFCFEYMVFSDYVLNHSDGMPEDVVAVAQEIADAAGKEKPAGMSTRQAAAGAVAYQGMTMSEIAEMVRNFKDSEAWGFSGMTRGDAYYKPMLELFNTLLENDFTVYIVTATERNIVREIINGTLDIPPSHVIGTEYGYTATDQGDTADADYTFLPADQIVFDGSYAGENAKTSKVIAIVREIGQQPVLAFGNSSGDLAMEIYTIADNPYKSAAYMVVADDGEREYGDAAGAEEKKQAYTEQGIGIISMKDDFKTIYGDDVVKASSEEARSIDFAEVFPSWNPDSASLNELVAFVSDCTDESSEGYLDPADRIATFDMDGTVLCEKAPIFFDYCLTMHRVLDDPTFSATDIERDAMQQVRDHAYSTGEKFKPATLTKRDLVASAFAGMTPEEFRAYVVDYADSTGVVGFEGMTYGQSFYKPMIEIIDFLKANDFDVWIVSACEREVSRALVERLGIPYDHVIATDVPYVASGKGDQAANKYNMGKEEKILLGAPLDAVSCEESGKPAAIAREIGKRPVLAFGNSSGDYSMLNYAEGNPKHAGMGFLVVCDDTQREYGSYEKAVEFYRQAAAQGWTAISMANDWAAIYGDGVQKTELPGTEETLEKAA